MSSKKSLAARLLTRAFRPRPATPHVRPTGPVGGRIEELEDRSVPALLSLYPADGNATDVVGGRNGVLGTTGFAAGQFGQAFSFDGTLTSQVTVAPDAAFDFTTGTVAGWINAPADSDNDAIFSMRTSVGTTGTRWSIHVNEAADTIGIWNGTSFQTRPATIVPGTWYHIAAVMTTTSTQFYVNGTSIGTVAAGINTIAAGRPFVIGSPNDDPGFTHERFRGLIDDVRVYNGAISAAEIAILGQGGQTVFADFATGVPAFLEQQGPAATVVGGTAQFNGGNDGFRTYLRTTDASYYTRSFVAEMDLVSTGTAISFAGLGQGVPVPGLTFEPGVPSIHYRNHAPSIGIGQIDARDADAGNGGTNTQFGTNPNTGPHRLRYQWDATTKLAILEVDFNPTSGTFVADASSGPINGADNGFTAANGRIFFGGAQGAVFDNLLITAAPAAPTGTLTASLAGTTLTLADTAGVVNTLTATVSGTNLVVTDTTEQFQSAPAGGVLSNGNKTLTIPLASVTSLVLNLAGGDDTATLNYAGGALPPVAFNGGAGGNDVLVLQGGTATTQTFNYTNATDGSVVLGGLGSVTYTGLDPITSSIAAAAVVLNYSTTGETITVTAAGAGQTTVTSTAGETTTFANPTASLAINAGDVGNDTITVTSLGSGFVAALSIDGGTGTDAITITPALNLSAAGAGLTLAAEAIALNGGSVTTSGSQSYTGAVTLGANTTTTGANVAFNGTVNSAGTGGSTQLLTNGNFETGSLTGWTTLTPQGNGAYFASAPGASTPTSGRPTVGNPSGGTTYAVSDESGPSVHGLLQTFTVPATATQVVLSYQMFVNDYNGAGAIVNPAGLTTSAGANQHARVDLLRAVSAPFSTAPADVLQNFYLGTDPPAGANPHAYLNYSFDITAFVVPGQTYQVRFADVETQFFLNVGVDNVSVLATSPSARSLTVNTPGATTFGAAVGGTAPLSTLSVTTGTLTAGAIATTGGVTVTNGGAASITGTVSGATSTLTKAGAGTLALSATNTYGGVTTVNAGVLALANPAVNNTTVQGTSIVVNAPGTLRLDLPNQLIDAIALTLNGGTWDVGSLVAPPSREFIGGLTLSNNALVTGTGWFIVNGTSPGDITTSGSGVAGTIAANMSLANTNGTFTGNRTQTFNVIGGTTLTVTGGMANFLEGGPVVGSLAKTGLGTLTLSGTNTYTGTTTVSAGRLNVNGSTAAGSAVTVNGGTLGGTGTVNGTVAMSSGTVATGTSPGILNSGSVTFTGGTFQAEVNGTTVGTQYDQLNVTGAVALGAGTTALSLPTPTITAGATYTLINNDGTDNVSGFFTGLPEGAFVGNFGGTNVYITYAGGSNNNDVQLLTTPTVNGTAGGDQFVLRQKAATPGSYQLSIDNGATFADLGAIATLTINGLGGNDTLTIDGVNGNPFPAGGVAYNGGTQASTPGDQLRVVNGAYTVITHNFTTASSGNVAFNDGSSTRTVSYTGLEPVLVNVGSVTDVIFNLPAAASAAVLEDDGTGSNGLSRLRSTNGTFEVTTFNNPTGSVTVNRGTAADTLAVTALPDLTSTLTVGTGAQPFQAVSVTGAVTLAATKDLTAFATQIVVTGAISADDVTLDADTGAQVAGTFVGADIRANVTGTGVVSVEGRGGATGDFQAGVYVRSGAVVSGGAGPGVTTLVTGRGGATTGDFDFGVRVFGVGSRVESAGGSVSVLGFGGGTAASGFSRGVAIQAGGLVTAGGSGNVSVTGTGGGGTGGIAIGVEVAATPGITSSGGSVTVTGTGGGGGASGQNYGVYVATGQITAGGTGAISVSGTGGGGTGGPNTGVLIDTDGAVDAPAGLGVTGTAGTGPGSIGIDVPDGTITAVGVATLNGPAASDISVAAASTANFGSLTVSAAGATVTIFEDSTTAVNTIAATTINLTSAGSITDNNAGANNLTGTTATLAAAGGIDLDTTLGSLTATTSAAGAILIDELDAITLTNVITTNGDITITAGGTVSAVNVVDLLDAAHVVSITTTAGDILVGNVVATGDTVALGAAGAIEELTPLDGTADVTADVVNMTAVTGIGAAGTVEINTITTLNRGLTASVTGTGPIDLADTTGGLRVRSATTANGSVTIAALGGDMIVETLTAGTLSAVNLSTTSSGSILDDDVNATLVTGGALTLTANNGAIGAAGATGQLDTTAVSISASSATGIWITETDAVTITSATTTNGVIELQANGTMTVTAVTAGGASDARLTTTAGDVALTGAATTVTAAGDRVLIQAFNGAITDGNGAGNNVAAASLILAAATGIDADTTVSILAGGNTTSGAVDVANTGNLTITSILSLFGFGAVGFFNNGTTTSVSTGNGTSNALFTVAQPVNGVGSVALTSDQDFTIDAGITVASSGGTVEVNADVAADADTTGAAVTVNGPITSGLTTANAVTINTGGDADVITVTQTGTSNLDVYGGGIIAPAVGFDQVTVVIGSLGAGFVRLNNSGSDNYHATVDGAAQATPLTFHANTLLNEVNAPLPSLASGVRRVSVNAATVLDYLPAGASLTVLSLLGGTVADTYYVQFTDPAAGLSLLPPLVNVAAAGASDAAFVYGTNGADTVDVNIGDNDRVTSAGVSVRYDGNLEALTVYGKDEAGQPGDTFAVRPDQQTATTIHGGTPVVYPGDTLELDVIGLVTLNPTLSDPALPAGNFSLTGYPLLSWTSIENFPVPRGLGGSFDFGTATSPVQFGFTQVLPTSTYPAAATAGTGWFGWATTPLYGNQAYQEPNLPPAVAASPIAALLQDFAYGFQGDPSNGVFCVDVAPNKPVQLTALVGVPVGGRDGLVVEWGVANSPTGLPTTWTAITPAGGLFTTGGEMTTVSAALAAADVGNNLSLFVRFRDVVGEPNWSISALDVRPTNPTPPVGQLIPAGLVAPLPLRREFSTDGSVAAPGGYADQHAFAAVAADGLTVDYFRGKDAIPGSLVTITVSNGTPVDAAFTAGDMALATRLLNPDAAGYLQQFQVQADAAGEFTFGVRRPTGTAPATVTAADATGFRAGAYTQPFVLPNARRLDFGPLPAASTSDYGNGGTVGAGYVPFAAATYTDAATNALGWTGANLPVPFAFGGTGTAVQRDAVFGGYAPSEFVLDMPAGDYVVTATLGDQGARRDDMFVEVWNGSAWVVARGFNPATNAYDTDLNGLTSPPGVAPDAGQSLVRSFLATTAGGQIRVRFGNVTGNPNWTLAALEVRPAQAALTITRAGGALTADGSTVTAYTVTGAAPGTVLTVRTALGSPAGADANTTYDGFQVVVPASGPTFSVKAPYSTTGVSSVIEAESVSGGERGTGIEVYLPTAVPTVPAVRRFDFNGASDDTNPNMVGVRGNQLWTAGADYGWLTAVNEFERATTSLPASMTAAQKALFRDGATLGGPAGTFRVKVDAGADYAVRYYVGDSYKKWPWIRLQVEGGTASGQLATNVNQYWSYVMFGKDADGDGYLDVKVYGTATWVLNAVDVAKGTTAAALPPSLLAASPQLAGFAVTSGTAPALTAAELAPIVVEATRRLVAAGADPGRLAAVTVSILDLNDAGRLGEHVPGSVHIDDDAGGAGWFVDPTPADDAEFGSSVAFGLGATDGAAARGVDLLTVVMHELSHELGLADLDPTANPADLMAEALDVGVRRLPAGLASAELPAPVDVTTTRPTTAEKPSAGTVLRPAPALWLEVAETVFAPGLPVVATDDRVRATVAPIEPVRIDPVAATPLAPSLAATPAWPDADSLFDLDGVYVG
ncbi:LamG-like jellyroll fold domain-containing protein [Urbifossiella limnaea]|uniref:Extracellular serine protease n=1 Tax=Urbifossiella limnaea TaxID=2528023 RepID=A0A517XZ71_9BACT|nr:LamG-like jellyroll fold domain-containing protein [Urbifossiella limnaea]QDU22816.1 Extracellular serine protease precursor [Urbifossiella limnaea]